MNGLALVGHQFRYDQKAFWRNPASVFFTVMFPVILFLILAVVFSGEDGRRPRRGRGDHLLRAGDHVAGDHLGDDADAGDDPGDRPRRRPPQARPRHADAALGLHRRPGRQLDRRRPDDAGPAGGDRRRPLRRRRPLGPPAGDPPHPRRRRRLLLLPRHRPHRRDPLPGRRRRDRQRAAAAALLPLRRLHPRRPAPRTASSPSPTSSRSATSSTPSSTPTSPPAAPRSPGTTSRSSPSGASPACCWRSATSAGPRVRLSRTGRLTGRPIASVVSMLHHVLLEVADLDRSAAFYDSMLAPLGWRRHFEQDQTIGWGIAKPVFFVSSQARPQPGFGLLSFSGAGDRRGQGGLGERGQIGRRQRQPTPASSARTAPAPTPLFSRTRTGTRSRSPSAPTSAEPEAPSP